jgi:hypothetical protein
MEMTEATPQKTFKQVCTCQNCGKKRRSRSAANRNPQKIKYLGRPLAHIAAMRPKY